MEHYKKHIDDIFREELSDYTESPPGEVWHELRNRLDGEKEKKRVIAWWWYGLVIALVVSGIGVTDRLIRNGQQEPVANALNEIQAAVASTPASNTAIASHEIVTAPAAGAEKRTTLNISVVKSHGRHTATSSNEDASNRNTGDQTLNSATSVTTSSEIVESGSAIAQPSETPHVPDNKIATGSSVSHYEPVPDTRKHLIKIAYSDSSVFKEKASKRNITASSNTVIVASSVRLPENGTNKKNVEGVVASKTNSSKPEIQPNAPLAKKQSAKGLEMADSKQTVNAKQIPVSGSAPAKKGNEKLLSVANTIAHNAARLSVTKTIKVIEVNSSVRPVENTNSAGSYSKESYKALNVNSGVVAAHKNGYTNDEKQGVGNADGLPVNAASKTVKNMPLPGASKNNASDDEQPVGNKNLNNKPQVKDNNPSDSGSVAKHRAHIEAGFKFGVESGFQAYTLNSIIGSPYLKYDINNKFSFIIQPGLKYSQLSNSSVIKPQSYYNIIDSGGVRGTVISWSGPGSGSNSNYYYEKYDSINISYHAIKTHWEVELPVLVRYNAGGNIMFSAGPVFTFGKVVTIAENRNQTTISRVDSTTNGSAFVYANGYYQHTALPYALYNPNVYQNTSSGILRFGYYIGMSYVLNKNMMLDLSVQQNISGMANIQNTDIKSLYTQPYFRVSFAYKLFDNQKK